MHAVPSTISLGLHLFTNFNSLLQTVTQNCLKLYCLHHNNYCRVYLHGLKVENPRATSDATASCSGGKKKRLSNVPARDRTGDLMRVKHT